MGPAWLMGAEASRSNVPVVLGVSVVLYRSPADAVLATMAGLGRQSCRPDVVLLHGNCYHSPALDGLADRIATILEPVGIALETSASDENLGFCGAHNRALTSLFERGCDTAIVLNPDLVLADDAIEELLTAARELPAAVLLGPLLELADQLSLAPTGRIDSAGIRWTASCRHLDSHQGEPLSAAPATTTRVSGISGACLVATALAYRRLMVSGEFFDEDFIAYREDAELAYRASLLGVPCYLVPLARGRHARRLRGTERGADSEIDRLGVRNRFLIAFKYGLGRPGALVPSLLRDGLVICGVLLRERSSIPGLVDAWHLRGRMREKGVLLREIVAQRQ